MAERVAGVDDILDHQHIPPLDGATQVFENPHFAARFHRVAIRRGLDEIDLDRHVQLAHQIGDEHKGAAQQAHNHKLFRVRELAPDVAAELFDAGRDRLGRDHLIDDIRTL